MSVNKLTRMFSGFDIYGHPIEITYKGGSQYKTVLGALCTLAVYGLIMFNAISLSQAFRDDSKQSELIQTSEWDRWYGDEYILSEHAIEISILTISMSESFGKMRVHQTFNCTKTEVDDCRESE